MGDPPRDENGQITPYDDPDILDKDSLLRRIHPTHIVPNKNAGGHRLSSMAFSESSTDPPGGMSVDVEPWMLASGVNPCSKLEEGFSMARLIAGDMRNLRFRVGQTPTEDNNPYHADVWNPRPRESRKIDVQDKFEWVVKDPRLP